MYGYPGYWAIPEVNGTLLKKTWDSQNFYSSFAVGIPPKVCPFYSRKGKEDMGIPIFFLISALFVEILIIYRLDKFLWLLMLVCLSRNLKCEKKITPEL